MARNVQWRRTISDNASWRQDQALNATIYILRNFGPTGFLLKEEGENKNFKVLLGDPHSCNCSVFTKEKDICKHICWVLLRKFRVPRENPVTWQLGLVEREINEILRGIMARQEPRRSGPSTPGGTVGQKGQPQLKQREISEDDVCPICQDELLNKHAPVTYCKFGCGNSVHIKCMKVWAEHQKSTGEQSIKCPFCREDFGPFELLKQEFRNSSVRDARAERLSQHLGVTCKKCHVCPVVGKCYRCNVCVDYHLCQSCFNTPTHQHHGFLYRETCTQRWRPAQRGSGTALPDAIVQNMMNRELTAQDYELLLQLDNQAAQQPSDLSLETLQSFPVEKIRSNSVLLAPGEQCRVCLRGYQVGQLLRKLPCRHKFHKECIDNWLLHQRSACPIDGAIINNETAARYRNFTNFINPDRHTRQQQQQNLSALRENRNANGAIRELTLEIPGVGLPLARRGSVGSSSDLPSGVRNGNHMNRQVRVKESVPLNSGAMNLELNGSRYGTIVDSIISGMIANSRRSNGSPDSQISLPLLDQGSQVAPSIPLPRTDVIGLGPEGMTMIVNSAPNSAGSVSRKPPTGFHTASDSAGRHRGRHRSRLPDTRGRQRSGSRERRSSSLDRPSQEPLLYIGSDPAGTSSTGYVSEFINSSPAARRAGRLVGVSSLQRQIGGATSQTGDDMILSGSAVMTGVAVDEP